MKPVRKKMPIQMAPFSTVRRKACDKPVGETCTAPICDIPRFSIRSPTLAHTTIAKTIISVLMRNRRSVAIGERSVVAGSGRNFGNRDHRFVDVAALADPLPALGAKLEE